MLKHTVFKNFWQQMIFTEYLGTVLYWLSEILFLECFERIKLLLNESKEHKLNPLATYLYIRHCWVFQHACVCVCFCVPSPAPYCFQHEMGMFILKMFESNSTFFHSGKLL